MAVEGDAKFEEKLTCGLNFGKLSPEHLKVGTFMGYFYPK